MDKFYADIKYEQALDIERLSRLAYELRENRKALLAGYGVSDEQALLDAIRAGSLAEHPSYEHYLAARILSGMHETARTLMSERLDEARRP